MIEVIKFDITAGDVHIDAPLSGAAMEYRPRGFIADQVFPIVDVPKQSDVYFVWNKDKSRQAPISTVRAPVTAPKVIQPDVSSGTYYAQNYALRTYYSIEEAANADVFDLKAKRASFLQDALMLDYEIRIANQVNSTSNVGASAACASAWTDPANDNPPLDLMNQIETFENDTGFPVTQVVFGKYAWQNFRKADETRRYINPFGLGGPPATSDQVQALFEVERILVGGAYQDIGPEGGANSLAAIWGWNVLLQHAPQTPAMDRPSLGYSLRWKVAEMPSFAVIDHGFDADRYAYKMDVGYYQDEKIVDPELGRLFVAVGSSQ
ncbi:MAG: hypothetical protein KKC37_10550 [Proteobacteria bacterium]|nr:hypothetical protein [Pseudomonadota bacterium]